MLIENKRIPTNFQVIGDGGAEALFYLNKDGTKAIKSYCVRSEGIYAFKLQKQLSKNSLAPKVLSKLYWCNNKFGNIFWYYTEIAKPVESRWKEKSRAFVKQRKKLAEKLLEEGIGRLDDLGRRNLGVIDKNLVVIDTGRLTLAKYSLAKKDLKCHDCGDKVFYGDKYVRVAGMSNCLDCCSVDSIGIHG